MSSQEKRKIKREKQLIRRTISRIIAAFLFFVLFALYIVNASQNVNAKEEVISSEIQPVIVEIIEEPKEEVSIVKEEPTYDIVEEVIIVESAEFMVTHYCGCSKCCGSYSDGSESEAYGCKNDKLTPMYSIAADPSILPYGTIVHDEEGNEYIVQDVGGWIKGYHIDMFTGDHQEALELGKITKTLYWEVKE